MPICHVNADDFGLHRDIDRGILACVDAGRVTGMSVSPNGSSVDWPLAREFAGRIDVGVHVTLVGEPWMTQNRTFAKWPTLMPWLMVPGHARSLETEIRTQIQTLLEQGITPTHLDSHQHVHVMPPIWSICVRLAKEFGIKRLRTPVTPHGSIAKQSIAGKILQRLSAARRRAMPKALPCIGIAHAGHNTVAILRNEIEHADQNDVELVAHPAFDSPALRARYGEWNFDWETERNALLSDEWGAAAQRAGYRFASPDAREPSGRASSS